MQEIPRLMIMELGKYELYEQTHEPLAHATIHLDIFILYENDVIH